MPCGHLIHTACKLANPSYQCTVCTGNSSSFLSFLLLKKIVKSDKRMKTELVLYVIGLAEHNKLFDGEWKIILPDFRFKEKFSGKTLIVFISLYIMNIYLIAENCLGCQLTSKDTVDVLPYQKYFPRHTIQSMFLVSTMGTVTFIF